MVFSLFSKYDITQNRISQAECREENENNGKWRRERELPSCQLYTQEIFIYNFLNLKISNLSYI